METSHSERDFNHRSIEEERKTNEHLSERYCEQRRSDEVFQRRIERNAEIAQHIETDSQKIILEQDISDIANLVQDGYIIDFHSFYDNPLQSSETINIVRKNKKEILNKASNKATWLEKIRNNAGFISFLIVELGLMGVVVWLSLKSNEASKLINSDNFTANSNSPLLLGNLIYTLFVYEHKGQNWQATEVPGAFKQQIILVYHKWLDEVGEEEFWDYVAQYCETATVTQEATEVVEYPTLADQIYFTHVVSVIANRSDDELWQWESGDDLVANMNDLVSLYNNSANQSTGVLYRQASKIRYQEQALPRYIAADLLSLALTEILNAKEPIEE